MQASIKSILFEAKDLNYHRTKFSTPCSTHGRLGLPFRTGLQHHRAPSAPSAPRVTGSSSPRARAWGLGAGRLWRWLPRSIQSAAKPGGGASDVGCASLRPTAADSRRCQPREPRARGRGEGGLWGRPGVGGRRVAGRGRVSMRSGSGKGREEGTRARAHERPAGSRGWRGRFLECRRPEGGQAGGRCRRGHRRSLLRVPGLLVLRR